MAARDDPPRRPSDGVFVTTHWSVVRTAQDPDSPQAAAALETLCRTYWYPLYAYARRQGHRPHDAQDLTQGFFERLLQKNYLRSVGQEGGRFRAFLLMAFKRFLANEWDRVHAEKRGGGFLHLSFDAAVAEGRYQIEPADGATGETVYERQWALTLLEQVTARLRRDYADAGKTVEFDCLKTFLTAERGGIPYARLAAELNQSEGAVRVAVHRLRRRFREIFRDAIAQTVSGPDEIDDEVRHLLSVLSR